VTVNHFFLHRQEVQEQGSQSCLAQTSSHELVAGAVPAAAAAVGKQHHTTSRLRNVQFAFQSGVVCPYVYQALSVISSVDP